MDENKVVCPSQSANVVEGDSSIVRMPSIPEDAYEKMCIFLYAYRVGSSGLLELLDNFKALIGIKPP
jgi:hypothetical protein